VRKLLPSKGQEEGNLVRRISQLTRATAKKLNPRRRRLINCSRTPSRVKKPIKGRARARLQQFMHAPTKGQKRRLLRNSFGLKAEGTRRAPPTGTRGEQGRLTQKKAVSGRKSGGSALGEIFLLMRREKGETVEEANQREEGVGRERRGVCR